MDQINREECGQISNFCNYFIELYKSTLTGNHYFFTLYETMNERNIISRNKEKD